MKQKQFFCLKKKLEEKIEFSFEDLVSISAKRRNRDVGL